MNIQTFVLVIVVVFFGLFWYSQHSWKNKVLCLFRKPNRTVIEKKVPLNSRYVIFDGGKYQVNPKRIDLMWYTRGIVHSFFPMFVPFLEFKHDTPQALDPTDFKHTWDTPEARGSTREEERFKALSRGFQAQAGKKQSSLERLLPWAAIGVTLIIGFMVYQLMQHVALLEQLIKVQK